jgi:hypothetical protein
MATLILRKLTKKNIVAVRFTHLAVWLLLPSQLFPEYLQIDIPSAKSTQLINSSKEPLCFARPNPPPE